MNFYDILLAKKLSGGGGGDITTEALNVTANGQYTAPQGKAYTPVNVNVAGYKVGEVETPTPIATFNDGTSNPLKSLTASIVPVQSGSGDPSPSNVRPFSGWTGCKVGNLGSKNWYDTRQSLLAGYLNRDGTAGGTGQSINKHTEKIPIKGGITYTYSVAVSRNADQVCLWYDKNNNVIDGFVLLKNTTSITAQAPINAESASLTVYNVDGQTIQLEAGSQATAYEPYNPNSTTATIPFTDSQGQSVEVFGGSVDVVNGALSEQFVCEKLPFSNYLTKTDLTNVTRYTYALSNEIDATDYSTQKCNMATVDASYTSDTPHFYCGNMNLGSRAYLFLPIGVESSVDVEFYYKLATPTTFYTQPTSIKSLDGDNNVFASTGDVEELKYFEEL